MPRRQQMAAMAQYRKKHPEYRDVGRTPHAMIEDSLLYGTDRYTLAGEEFLQKWDRYYGIDPEIGKQQRNLARCEREALFQIEGRGIAEHSDVARHFKKVPTR